MNTLGTYLVALALALCLAQTIPAQSMADYYPLRVGNTWTYTSLSGTYTETITGTEIDGNGDTWYLFDYFRHIENVYVRMDSQNNLLLKKDNKEALWLKFGAAKGDSWQAEFPGSDVHTVTLQATDDTATVPHGMFTNVYRFYFAWEGADNDYAEYYVRFIGPIRRILYGFGVIVEDLVSYNGTLPVPDVPHARPEAFRLGAPYPNPASGLAMLPIEVRTEHVSAQTVMHDMLGRTVYGPVAVSLNPGYNAITVPLHGIPAGLYTVTMLSGATRQSQLISVTP